MPKRSSKRGANQIAKSIIDQVSGENQQPVESDKPTKNPAAVELGRLGGKKGGPARAAKLTANERSTIAKKAADMRWAKKNE